MACEEFSPRLERYLDGELPASEVAALEAHIKGCASCLAEALSRRELSLAIREAGASFRESPALRARVVRTLHPRPRPALWLVPLAAALVVGAGLLALRGTPGRAGLGVREVVDLHVTQLASVAPLDVLSSDKHTVKPWFEGKVPFSFDLPEFSGSPFELLGGRVVYLDQEPAAHLLFGMRRHKISVFVLRESAAPDLTALSQTRAFRVLSFTQRGLRWVIVSDTSPEDVEDLARRLGRT